MKGTLIPFFILAMNAAGYQYWNSIRHSALLPDQTIVMRVENPDAENFLLFRESGVEEEAMTFIPDGPSTFTATVPGPVSETRRYGFRLIQGGDMDLFPVATAPGGNPPPPDLTRFRSDPQGDEVFGYTHLDIVDSRVSFTDTEFFASITNAGGGFPVSSGITFFAYLFGITDPAQSNPDTVFALMYTVDSPGIITPGLYIVTGTGMGDLEKIGDIEVQEYPSSNTIRLTCQLADLMEDPYFQTWYDPSDPTLAVAAFTQRITLLGGPQEADNTDGGRIYLRELSISPASNQLPELTNPGFTGSGPTAAASVDYFDPDGNCPVIMEILFDSTDSWPMYPLTLDYGSTVTYTTAEGIDPLASGNWSQAVFRFSDNISDVIEYQVYNAGVSGLEPAHFTASAENNPFTGTLNITVSLPEGSPVTMEIFDISGRLVNNPSEEILPTGPSTMMWTPHPALPAGCYTVRISAEQGCALCRCVLLR